MAEDIVIVDDEPRILASINRSIRKFNTNWNCYFFTSGMEAIEFCLNKPVDLIVTDGRMPKMNGCEMLEILRANPKTKDVPAIMLTGYTDQDIKARALKSGIIEYLNKPIEPKEFFLRLKNVLRMKTLSSELDMSRMELIRKFGKTAENRAENRCQQISRTANYSRIIAEAYELPQEQVELIFHSSVMYDFGKIDIPDKMQCKSGASDPINDGIIQDILNEDDTPLLNTADLISATHHERWDGKGYPKGLKGKEIPIEGRIFAIAHILDTLTSEKSHKETFSIDLCFEIISSLKGTYLDPELVDCFLKIKDKISEEWLQLQYL